jgi:hypothetical protein
MTFADTNVETSANAVLTDTDNHRVLRVLRDMATS